MFTIQSKLITLTVKSVMIKWYDLDSEFTSGKYEGLTLKEVFQV